MYWHYTNLLLIILFFLIIGIHISSFSQETISNNMKIQKLSDKVYVIQETERYPVNLAVITNSSETVLLDTGFKIYANDLIDTLKSLNSGKVVYIINSHIDRDHVEANFAFGTDLIIIGHKHCDEFFKQSGARSITFDESYSFKFNDLEIQCIAYPGGHTACDIVVYVPVLKIAYLGDLYLSQSFPRIDLESGSKAQVLLNHLKKIHSTLPENTKLIPGHGRITNMIEFKVYIDMVDSTMKIIKAEMNKGKSLKEIQDVDVLKDWENWGIYFAFINKNSWINNVYMSYSGQ